MSSDYRNFFSFHTIIFALFLFFGVVFHPYFQSDCLKLNRIMLLMGNIFVGEKKHFVEAMRDRL